MTKHPPGSPMTPRQYARAGRHAAYGVVPEWRLPTYRADRSLELTRPKRRSHTSKPRHLCQVRQPRQQDRRAAELERATDAVEPDGQAMALSALIKRARNSGRACRLVAD